MGALDDMDDAAMTERMVSALEVLASCVRSDENGECYLVIHDETPQQEFVVMRDPYQAWDKGRLPYGLEQVKVSPHDPHGVATGPTDPELTGQYLDPASRVSVAGPETDGADLDLDGAGNVAKAILDDPSVR